MMFDSDSNLDTVLVSSHLYEPLLLAPAHLGQGVYHNTCQVHLHRVVLETLPGQGGVVVHVAPLGGDGHPLAILGSLGRVVGQHLLRCAAHRAESCAGE